MKEVSHLVEAAQAGDGEAYAALVQRFQGMAYAIAYRYVGDHHLAQDLVQDAITGYATRRNRAGECVPGAQGGGGRERGSFDPHGEVVEKGCFPFRMGSFEAFEQQCQRHTFFLATRGMKESRRNAPRRE